jgi:hydrogenase/urease accessory protein HupE
MFADTPYLLSYPEIQAMVLVMVLSVGLYGALGVWVGLGRWHWFPRAFVLMVAVGMLLPVRAESLGEYASE